MSFLRVLLCLAFVFVAHGYSEGAGVTIVVPGLDNIHTMVNQKNEDPGIFVAEVVDGDTNYEDGVAKTIKISGGDMAGILGYFGDDDNKKHGKFHTTGDLLQTSWGIDNSDKAFTHTGPGLYGDFQTELQIDWNLNIWKVAPAVVGGANPTKDFSFSATPVYDGKVYYVVQSAGAAAPSVAQVKAGHSSNDEPAMSSGNAGMTADTKVEVVVPGLDDNGAYKLYVVGEASTPEVYFYYYILGGKREDASSEFYRNVPTDAEILKLTPASDPLDTPLATFPFGAASALRPVFWLACGLMAVLARLL